MSDAVHLETWSVEDLPLLRRLTGDPAMMEHLGGAERPEKIAERQERYAVADSGQFRIVAAGEAVGWVGYWEREWRDAQVYEVGWSVLPEFQGRGIAAAATAQLIERLREVHGLRALHAYPSVANPASNAICRKLGFALLGAHDFEFPPGQVMRCNHWRLELF